MPTHLYILALTRVLRKKRQSIRPYNIKSIVVTLKIPQGNLALEEEKAWLDRELVVWQKFGLVNRDAAST